MWSSGRRGQTLLRDYYITVLVSLADVKVHQIIGGVLEFEPGAEVRGFPRAANLKPKTTNTASDIRDDLNELVVKLKNAGVMIPDDWEVSVLACPAPASMSCWRSSR